LILTGVAAALLSGAGRARADEASDYRAQIERQRTQQAGFMKNYQALPGGKKRIEEIVSVTTEDGRLAIKSPLFSADAAAQMRNKQLRAEVEGFEGFCTVMVQSIGNGQFYFTFSNMSYPNLEGVSNVTISMQPGYLQISRNYNSRTRNANVSLVQSQGRQIYGQPDGVQMSVYGGDNTGRSTASINVSEPDFMTLRRKHARAVNEHLRPLLRDLKLESLFAVDAVTAWQVFADDWRGDDAMTARVRALLPGLDADGYDERDKARQAMRDLGPNGAMTIYRMGRGDLTAEQNCQLDAVLASHSFLSRTEAGRLIGDVDFLLDCLYSEDASIRDVALRHLRKKTGRELPVEPKADYAARSALVETLRAELSRTGAGPTTRAAKG
jgi:hypothetical protein